jgi:hypothetical protein
VSGSGQDAGAESIDSLKRFHAGVIELARNL